MEGGWDRGLPQLWPPTPLPTFTAPAYKPFPGSERPRGDQDPMAAHVTSSSTPGPSLRPEKKDLQIKKPLQRALKNASKWKIIKSN